MSETTTVETPAPEKEIWIYAGVRVGTDKKLYHNYVDASGKERWYSKQIGGSQVGALYEVPVVRTGESVSVIRDSYRYVSREESPRVTTWIVEHNAQRAWHETLRVDQQVKNALLDLTLAQLRDKMKRTPTPRRRALLAVVLDILTKGGGEL